MRQRQADNRWVRRGSMLLTAALAALTLGSGQSSDPGVSVTSASVTGSSVQLRGVASFPAVVEPQSVGGAVAKGQVGGSAAGDAGGLALQEARIVPLADGSGLRFIWQVADLPEQVPPEGVRYTWAFRIGTRQFQLQAKRTNVVSSTTIEDPVGHVQHAAGGRAFFQLRGACETAYLGTPVSGCYHLAFLNGSFDRDTDRVSVDLPFSTRDSIGRLVAPEFVPGVTISEQQTANMSIAASFQAFVSNTITSQYINGWQDYHVGPRVEVGVGRALTAPEAAAYTARAALAADGTWTATVTGLDEDDDTVFVRACNATRCAYATLKPTA